MAVVGAGDRLLEGVDGLERHHVSNIIIIIII